MVGKKDSIMFCFFNSSVEITQLQDDLGKNVVRMIEWYIQILEKTKYRIVSIHFIQL